MRQLALVTLAVFCIQTGFSQNLVPNASFEEQVPCEQFQSLLSNGSAEPWTTANAGSADVYNTDCIWAGSQNNGVCSAGIILPTSFSGAPESFKVSFKSVLTFNLSSLERSTTCSKE